MFGMFSNYFFIRIIDAFNLYSKQFDAFSRKERWKLKYVEEWYRLSYSILKYNKRGVLIRSGGVEKNQKINKRAPLVLSTQEYIYFTN